MNQTYFHYLLFVLCKLIHKKHLIALSVIFLTGAITISSSVQAQTIPQQITYQGKLVQDGVPFSGSTTMIFELVNPTTNAIAWTETQTINVQDGLYSVVLGVQMPFTPDFFSQNPSLGLRVSVNGNPLTPITVLRAVPYAHAAGSVADNSITSVKITNGTIQTIDIASGGQNKILATDANGLVVWIDRTSITTPTPTLQQVLNTANDAGNNKIINLATPTDPQDVANKAYVDAITGGSLQDLSTDATLLITGGGAYDGSTAETISVADGGVTTAKIANNAVTELKILDNAVTTNKIVNGTIKAEDIEPTGAANDEILVSNGSTVAWTPTTSLSITENDPKIGSSTNNSVPRWDNTNQRLIDGSIIDDGNDVTISTTGQITLNPSTGFTVNSGDDITITSSSNFIGLNSDVQTTGNLNVGNNLQVANEFTLNSKMVNDITLSTDVFGSSDNNLVTEAAVGNYVASQLSSIPTYTAGNGININTSNVISLGDFTTDLSLNGNSHNYSLSGLNSHIINSSIISLNDGSNEISFDGTGMQLTHSGNILVNSPLLNVSNNLTIGNQLNLVNPTPINYFDGTNTLTLAFPASPLSTNQIITFPDATGTVALTTDFTNYTFQNGLTENSGTIHLGGTLTQPTTLIDANNTQFGITEFNALSLSSSQGGSFIKLETDLSQIELDANVSISSSNASINLTNDISLNATGTVFLQNIGGDLEVGDNSSLNSELTVNGWLNLPSLTTLPSITTNKLYAQGGALFWENQNLSAGATNPWEIASPTTIYFDGILGNTNVGIGNFTTTALPSANLHLRRLGTEAEMRIVTLAEAANLNDASKITLRTARRSIIDDEEDVTNDQLLGKILFEGYKTNFIEGAKIETRLLDFTNFTNELAFHVDGNKKMSIADDAMQITLIPDAEFSVQDDNATPNRLLFLERDINGKNEFEIQLASIDAISSPSGGKIELKAQDVTVGLNTYEGSKLYLEGANVDGVFRGGDVFLDAGAGDGDQGTVYLQFFNEGNVEVGSGTDSELRINGSLNLPSLGSFPTSTNPNYSNLLYADNTGELYWGDINLSGGVSPWDFNGSNIYYDAQNVGIGNFSSLAPEADLHIRRVGLGTPSNIKLSSARDISGSPDALVVGDPVGELIFNGYNGSTFQDVGRIEMVTTSAVPLEAEMNVNVNGGAIASLRADNNVLFGNISSHSISTNNVSNATISGGISNSINLNSSNATISGGASNQIANPVTGSFASTIGGGFSNIVGSATISSYSTIAGGRSNVIDGSHASILGGRGNRTSEQYASVLGGEGNQANGSHSFVSGQSNTAISYGETVIGLYSGNGIAPLTGGNPTTFVPTDRLFVVGNGVDASNRSNAFVVYKNGNTDINGNLDVAGTGEITASNVAITSDIRYKKQIHTLNNSLTNIQKLRGTNYYWKDEKKDQRLQFGVIAQEIEEVFPNLVHTNEEGYKSVNYIGLVPVLIEATKEQQIIIDNQKEEIQTQKTELEALKKQINELKQIFASLQ